jgi:hypothetical protein
MKAGARYFSAVCESAVVVVRAPAAPVNLACGGVRMTETPTPPSGTPEPGLDTGTALGKRYVDETTGVELLATKPGGGTLTLDGRVMELKQAKPLPSSD